MTTFAYVSVMMSIVVGLALTDMLTSLHRLVRAGSRVRWHWAPVLAALLVTLAVIQIWWRLYSPDEIDMTISRFLPLLVQLVILFLLSAAALPDSVDPDGIDLRVYYDRNGPYFWSLFAAALAWPTVVEALAEAGSLQGLWAFLVDRLGDLIALAVFVSLIFVRRLWWHALAFVLLSLGPIGWLSRSLG